ncbi:MAG: CapA family protein [Clostridia bacterium]|nr:CapA family protein [Clostridia bacterium]
MKKKPGFSLGTILALCLTVAVTVGCIFLFGKIRGSNSNVRMDAQRVLGVMGAMIQTSTDAPNPQATVRTVTVTLAPLTAPPVENIPAPTATPAPALVQDPSPQRYSFSLTAGGLLEFDSDISDSVYNKQDKSVDYRPIVSPISAKIYADMNLVTLPQVVNTADRKYGDTLVPSEAAEAVRFMGFDEVILGTEHVLDQGAPSAGDTVTALTARGLLSTGLNLGTASQCRMVPINGTSVAILSYTDILTQKTKNTLKSQPSLFHEYDPETVRQDIQNVRNQGARFVIVCIYWGKTDAASVTNAQKNTARSLAEMGADVILGTRPTRVLPMEIITTTGADGKARDTFVAYSLGTLLSESREAYDIAGILLHLNLTSDEQGRVHLDSAEYTPTYIWRQTIDRKTQYRIICSADAAPEEMSEQQKEVMGRALNRIQTTLKDSPVSQRR